VLRCLLQEVSGGLAIFFGQFGQAIVEDGAHIEADFSGFGQRILPGRDCSRKTAGVKSDLGTS
jgi:hypothetical protein